MSVKKLYRALISSPFVSERSAPDGSNQIDISSVITGGTPSTDLFYTPPADGYVSFAINNNSQSNMFVRINAENVESALTVAPDSDFSTGIRVRRGSALSLYFSVIPQVYRARFIRTVGGGGGGGLKALWHSYFGGLCHA